MRSAPQAARAEVRAEGVLWALWVAPQAPPPPAQQAPHAPASPWQAGEVPRVLWEAQAQGWVEVMALGSSKTSKIRLINWSFPFVTQNLSLIKTDFVPQILCISLFMFLPDNKAPRTAV